MPRAIARMDCVGGPHPAMTRDGRFREPPPPPHRVGARRRQLADGSIERDLSRAAARLPDGHPRTAGGGDGSA